MVRVVLVALARVVALRWAPVDPDPGLVVRTGRAKALARVVAGPVVRVVVLGLAVVARVDRVMDPARAVGPHWARVGRGPGDVVRSERAMVQARVVVGPVALVDRVVVLAREDGAPAGRAAPVPVVVLVGPVCAPGTWRSRCGPTSREPVRCPVRLRVVGLAVPVRAVPGLRAARLDPAVARVVVGWMVPATVVRELDVPRDPEPRPGPVVVRGREDVARKGPVVDLARVDRRGAGSSASIRAHPWAPVPVVTGRLVPRLAARGRCPSPGGTVPPAAMSRDRSRPCSSRPWQPASPRALGGLD